MMQESYIKEMPLGIVGGNSFGRYAKISTEETFNMMISDDVLVPTPGYRKVVNIGGEGRGLWSSTQYNHMIAVIDSGVYSISTDNSVSLLFKIATNSGDVFISENDGSQIGIADGQNIYIFNYHTNEQQSVTGVDFMPSYLDFQDGYFISCGINTSGSQPIYNQWRLSDPNDGTKWKVTSSNVGVLQDKADTVVATVNFNKQLFVMGRKVTDLFVDNDYQLMPYQRNNYMNIDYGCLNPATIATGSIELGEQQQMTPLICWLGINEKSGPAIMYSTGGAPSQLSTDGINYKIEQLSHPEDAYGFIYRLAGHTCYQITWPTDNLSYLIDFNTHKIFTVTDENLNHHIAKRMVFFNNKYYFLSINDGNLYEMGTDLSTYDYSNPTPNSPKVIKEIPRIRIPGPLHAANSEPFIVNYLDLTLEQGNSKTLQRIDLSLSVDGGISYGNTVSEPLNALAYRQNRFRYWGLGLANDFRPQFRFWGFERFVITNGVVGIYQ